jgi:hypothetical protein
LLSLGLLSSVQLLGCEIIFTLLGLALSLLSSRLDVTHARELILSDAIEGSLPRQTSK